VVSSVFAAKGVYGRDGVNMLIAKDEKSFVEKILEVKNNPKLRARIIYGGAKTVRKFFDWKIPGKIIEAVIRKDARKK
jgi:glycosyltransferase involved in cell wall biosynthesis